MKKGIWEKIFKYPSFDTRFYTTLLIVIFVFGGVLYISLFRLSFITGITNQIAVTSIIIQLATLVLGGFAAYYALRQLVETRFINLDEAASSELQRKRYSKAVQKWKEAFYIRPEANIFTNLTETLLIMEDYDNFDQYIKISESVEFLKKEIFQEASDQIILLYLKSTRNLLVKNQGEAEKHINKIVELVKKEGFANLQWNFLDLQTSKPYQDLTGECKNMLDNLISYLSKTISPTRKSDFEDGNFASQIV